jgi:hypothetical protein
MYRNNMKVNITEERFSFRARWWRSGYLRGDSRLGDNTI